MQENHKEQLEDYITGQLQAGLSPDDIADQLATAGWPAEHVHDAFRAVQARMAPHHLQQAAPPTETVQPQTAAATARPTDPAPAANGGRWGRFKTGWTLFKQSMRI